MHRTFLGFVVLCAVMQGSLGSPWFCHDIECPKFTTEAEKGKVEIRNYEATAWVQTNFTGAGEDDYSLAVGKGFNRLFRYISGANEKNVKIPMTAPVLVNIHPGAGPNCNTTFTVGFFVPFEFQKDVPKPASDDVYVKCYGPGKVAVMSFGGYAMGWEAQKKHFTALAEKLQDLGVKFKETPLATAGYDSPFRILNRHNEVWYYLE